MGKLRHQVCLRHYIPCSSRRGLQPAGLASTTTQSDPQGADFPRVRGDTWPLQCLGFCVQGLKAKAQGTSWEHSSTPAVPQLFCPSRPQAKREP